MKKEILLLMVFGIVFSGLSISDVELSPDPIMPGGYGTITATVSSTMTVSSTGTVISGGDVIERINVEVLSYYSKIEVSSEAIVLGDLDAGASTEVSIPIYVNGEAESGSYLVKVKAEGWVDQSEGGDTYNEKSATVVVNVLNSPALSLETEQNVISEKEEVIMIIVNDGGTAKNVRMTVGGDFALENTNEIYVGDVTDETEVVFVLDASEASAGANDVEFTLEYYDELGNEESETKTIRLNIVKEESVVTIVQNSEITSNQENTIKLLIMNTGKNIEELKISFPNEDLKLKESEKIVVGDMYADEEEEIEVVVFASINPGVTQVEAQIEWKENGEEKSDTIKIPLTVSSDTSIGIYLEAKPTPLRVGQEHTLVVLVSNLGSYKINNVDVGIESDSLDLLDVQSSDYIGEMSSDDFSTVQFKVMPKQEGTQEVTVTITYKDQSGEWITENITREILVYGSESDGEWFLPVAGLAVIIVLVWYFKFRKRGTK